MAERLVWPALLVRQKRSSNARLNLSDNTIALVLASLDLDLTNAGLAIGWARELLWGTIDLLQ